MSAFPKADVQNVRIGVEPNVCLWLPFQPIDALAAGRQNAKLGSGHWALTNHQLPQRK